jgi:hypothetical protein
MKRFVIKGRQYGATQVRDICWCDTNPEPIVQALKNKRCLIGVTLDGREVRIGRYDQIEIVDNSAADTADELRARGETAGHAGTAEGN